MLYPNKQEPAYSVLRMGLSSGYLFGFLVAILFEITVILWILVCLLTVSVVMYSVLVFTTQKREQLFPCLHGKKDEKNEEKEEKSNHANGIPNGVATDFEKS